MEKITKQELKQPDVFIRTVDQLNQRAIPVRGLLITLLSLFLIVGVGYALWEYISGAREARAQADVFIAQTSVEKRIKELDEKFQKENSDTKAGKDKKMAAPQKAPERPHTDVEGDLGPQLKELEAVIQKHKGSRASLAGALELANIYHEYKADDRAVAALEQTGLPFQKGDLITSSLHLRLGDLKEAQGRCADALPLWEKVAGPTGFGPLKSEALLRQGLCYENLNQADRARAAYESLTKDYAETRAGRAAKRYLRLLQSKSST